MKKRFWAFALMVVMLISIFPVSVLAAAPGTRQQLTKETLDERELSPVYHSKEDSVSLTLYCFNSELEWPTYNDEGLNNYYVPDEMLHLSDDVKDKVYRIFYAGYPHNNLGLYGEPEGEIKRKELDEAVVPPDKLKELLPDYDWDSLNFTPEQLVKTTIDDTTEPKTIIHTREYDVMNDLYTKMSDSKYLESMISKPNFINFLYIWGSFDYADVEGLFESYKYFKPTQSKSYFHDATQIAIWRILHENNVPNNKKSMMTELARYPLAKELVDFANGKGEHKDAKIPPRGTTADDMKEYKKDFEKGLKLLRNDESPVGTNGTIVFTKKDGQYVSELLHFENDTTYALPFEITLNDGTTKLYSTINHADGNFQLYSSAIPADGEVIVKTDDVFPSDVYQYVMEKQKDIPAEDLSHDKHNYQDMSGVYYQSVPMAMSFKTLFREEQESGNLKVTKTVNGYPAEASSKEFKFTVELSDDTINGLYGSMNFENGVATFTLQGGHFREADNLPVNITYTVTEEDYSGVGFTTEKTGDTGTITKDHTSTASFTNTYKAESVDVTLKGNKTMNGKNLSEGEFSFTITGDKAGGTVTVKNKADGSIDFDTYNFDAAGIYTFVIKEFNDGRDGINYDNTVYNITVTVTDDGSGLLKATITGCAPTGDNINFTNGIGGGDDHDDGGGSSETSITRNGSLTISKNVTGDLGDKNKLFTFHVAFNTDNYYAYTGSKTGVIKNGGTLQLKDGESITINGIPSGVAYAIVESDNAGYRVYKTGDAGIIVADQTLKASFTNTKSSVPQTGDNRHLFIWMGIMAISFIGCIISLVFTIRKRESHE